MLYCIPWLKQQAKCAKLETNLCHKILYYYDDDYMCELLLLVLSIFSILSWP